MARIFVNVIAEHNIYGITKPIAIIWEDGRKFSIDRVLDIRNAGETKAGGCGMRYRCRIHGKEVDLFDENGKWFIEK